MVKCTFAYILCFNIQAIDVWMGLCIAFVFAALVEFTIVNFWFRKQRQRAGIRVRYLENGKIQRVNTPLDTYRYTVTVYVRVT